MRQNKNPPLPSVWQTVLPRSLYRPLNVIIYLTSALIFAAPYVALAQTSSGSSQALPSQANLMTGTADSSPSIAQMPSGDIPGNVHVDGGPAPFGIPAKLAVNPNTGAVTYSVPIDVPPGVAGMQPKLALQYNSMSTNDGELGMGWSTAGLSLITRCAQTIATNNVAGGVNDDANDRFCVDGQQLLAVAAQGSSTVGAYGGNGTNYAREIDDLSEIISSGGSTTSPAYFTIHTKSGLTLEYGNTSTSANSQLLSASGNVVEVWALDKVTDEAANYMTITYISDAAHGAFYPSQISYSGNTVAGTSTFASVVFGWQTRTDTPVLYAAGSGHQNLNRLQSVKTYVGSTLVSDYELTYQYGVSTQRSDLTSITKLDGSSPQNSLLPLTFTYSDAQIDTGPDLLIAVANGLGALTSITFLPATSPSVDALAPNSTYPQEAAAPTNSLVLRVQHTLPVTSFVSSSTLGNTNDAYATQYYYANPTVNLAGRGDVGFAASLALDLQTGLQQEYLFWLVFPLIGDPVWSHEMIASNGNLADDTTYSYGLASSVQNMAFPYVSQSVETRSEVVPGSSFSNPTTTSALPTITKSYTYDTTGASGTTWGNLTQMVASTSDGYSTTTANTYLAANITNWLTGLKSQTSITAQGINGSAQTRITTFGYNNLGQMSSQVMQPGGSSNITSSTSYTYDNFGNINQQTISGSDIASVTTKTNYTSPGQFPTTLTNALNQTETIAYDTRFGKITNDTSVNNQTTTYSYDTFGRQTQKVGPDGSYDTTSYSTCVVSSCSPLTETVEDQEFASNGTVKVVPTKWVEYDPIGRQVITDTQVFSGATSQIADIYDANGNLAQHTNPYIAGATPLFTTNTYDELGRILTTTHPDGSADNTVYSGTTNATGETMTATNGLGQTSTMFKDGHGNVSWIKDSLGNTLTFAYDGFDQRISATDPASNVTSYVFDVRGRTISGTDPDKGAWTASYNSLGQLVGTNDAIGNSSSISYDLLGRMTQRVETGAAGYTNLTANWVYDPANGIGELGSESSSGTASPSGSSAVGYTKIYTYDSLGRLIQTAITEPQPWSAGANGTYTQTYSYDSASRPIGITTGWGDGFTTNYNSTGYKTGQVQTSTGNALWTETASDAANSILSSSDGTAITQSFAYDPNTERMTSVIATGPNSTTLASLNYSYDVLGNVLTKTNNATVSLSAPFTEYYSYDGLNRLCTVNSGSSNLATVAGSSQPCQTQPAALTSVGISATYDALGDLTAKLGDGGVGTYTYPASGQPRPHAVTAIANSSVNSNGGEASSFTYDADGNLITTSCSLCSDTGRSLTYTAFGMSQKLSQNGNTASFAYGPDHDRVSQIETGTGAIDTLYLDGMNVTAPPGGSMGEVFSYFDDNNGQIVGEVDRTGVSNLSSNTGGTTGTGSVKFFLNDWQNSVSTIASSSGSVLEADSYDAWGKRRNINGAPDANSTITSQTIHGYTNQEHLQNVELVDLNARMYDPYIGVMLSVDPAVANWTDPQTWNAYAYARDNPMRYTDPTGEWESGASTDGEASDIFAETATAIYGGGGMYAGGDEGSGAGGGGSFDPTANLTDGQEATVASGGAVKLGAGFVLSGAGGNETLVDPGGSVQLAGDPISDTDGVAGLGAAGAVAQGLMGGSADKSTSSKSISMLQPYNEGGGHHVPAKSAFRGATNYDQNKALAIPNAQLSQYGDARDVHQAISSAQNTLYRAFAKTGQPLTWDIMRNIETQSLESAVPGLGPGAARGLVNEAIQGLQNAGVANATRVPWGGQ